MTYDNEWLQQTLQNREQMVRETIRPVTAPELKKLGATRFPVENDPWRERYNAFLAENRDAKFYLAQTPEGAEIVYCSTAGRAIWFLAGKGMGIVEPRGLDLLAEIVSSRSF